VVDAAFDDHIVVILDIVQIKDLSPVIDPDRLDAPLFQFFQKMFFILTYQ
jgi:hypothetical protein